MKNIIILSLNLLVALICAYLSKEVLAYFQINFHYLVIAINLFFLLLLGWFLVHKSKDDNQIKSSILIINLLSLIDLFLALNYIFKFHL